MAYHTLQIQCHTIATSLAMMIIVIFVMMMTMITEMTTGPGSGCSFDPRPPPPRPLSCKNDPCPLNHQCCRFWSTSLSSTFFILQSPSTWSIWLPPALEGGLVVVTQTSDARREFVFDWNLIGKRSETTSKSVPVTIFSSQPMGATRSFLQNMF